MGKLTIILILLGNMLTLTTAGLELTLTSSECSSYYDMEDIGEDAYLTYNGASLNNAQCSVKFTNYQTWQKQTCIKPERINLGCSTTVEYFRHFISDYIDPVRKFTCGKESYDEWCGPQRTTNVYLVIRTSSRSQSSYFRLHIYLKKLPGSDSSDSYSSSSSTGAIVGAGVAGVVVFFILTGSLIACKVAQQRRQAMPRTPYTVVSQTSAAPGNACSNQPLHQPVYQPPQQAQFQPGLPGYHLHPMQSAFPVSTEQRYNIGTGWQPSLQAETGRHSPARFHQPTAPPVGHTELPPSYESVLK